MGAKTNAPIAGDENRAVLKSFFIGILLIIIQI
jgi:hypothetical protein